MTFTFFSKLTCLENSFLYVPPISLVPPDEKALGMRYGEAGSGGGGCTEITRVSSTSSLEPYWNDRSRAL